MLRLNDTMFGGANEDLVDESLSIVSHDNIDPAILRLSSTMFGGANENSVDESISMLAQLVDPLEDLAVLQQDFTESGKCTELVAPPLELIGIFSRINVYCHVGNAERTARGGSRDDPTQFRMACKNQKAGCNFTTYRRDTLANHELNCSITPENPPSEPLERKYGCTKCTKSFTTKALRRKHMENHNWVPKPCLEPGCDPNVILSYAQWKRHRRAKHGVWTPQVCPEAAQCKKPKPL